VHVPPVEFLDAQLVACFEDFDIRAVKIGMLASAEVIHAVADFFEAQSRSRVDAAAEVAHPAPLRRRASSVARSASTAGTALAPVVVLDPVMVATSGARLLADDALDALRTRLLPLAGLLTPNLPEAEWLLGHAVHGDDAMAIATGELRALGARAVLLKGGHARDGRPRVLDLLDAGGHVHRFEHPRLPLQAHGTGCTLASAIAARLARGDDLVGAVAGATDYVHAALVAGATPGLAPLRVLDHMLGRPPAG
jgi:hydroxymethylpyrimidine/phosphomethylpyrimidine kinase